MNIDGFRMRLRDLINLAVEHDQIKELTDIEQVLMDEVVKGAYAQHGCPEVEDSLYPDLFEDMTTMFNEAYGKLS